MATPAGNPSVAIIIVAYNDWDTLERCIASIEAGTYRRFRIILVDNSTNGKVAERAGKRDGLVYLGAGRNVGFSRGVNLGLELALRDGADFALLLNPDTELETGCLGELVRAAGQVDKPGILGGRIGFAGHPDRIWYAGGRLSRWQGVGKHFRVDRRGAGPEPIPVSYVTGCCMLIPAGVIREAGMLSPDIFMYLDDAEYCLRVSRKGYRLYYVPTARLSHAVGPGQRTLGYPPYYLYFSIRNKPFVAPPGWHRAWLRVFAVLLGASKLAIYGLSRGVADRRPKLKAILWGAWDAMGDEAREEARFPHLFSGR